MTSQPVLYVASSSSSRQNLLREARIPFSIISHSSSEEVEYKAQSPSDYVLEIARDKMNSVVLPSAHPTDYFVLTADSLVYGETSKTFFGKPGTIEKAREMMRAIRNQTVQVITGCCLVYHGKQEQRKEWVSVSRISFNVPDEMLDLYLQQCPNAIHSAGGGILEGFGSQFLKSIEGSYSGALGLPLFELRQALFDLGFNG